MEIEARLENPVCLKLAKDEKVILVDDDCEKSQSLIPGVIFEGEHYGFVLITDNNKGQKEYVYPTQCRIEAMGIENKVLRIFEDGKKNSWKFDLTGKLTYSLFNDFTEEFRSKLAVVMENYDMFNGEFIMKNPMSIKITKNPDKSVILKDDEIKEDYPLFPGAIIGGKHYGFILKVDTDNGQKEIIYPTQNNIDAIGIERCNNGEYNLKVFEKGKYIPWLFTPDGKFKQQSSYNEHSKRDRESIYENHVLKETVVPDAFTFQKKNK